MGLRTWRAAAPLSTQTAASSWASRGSRTWLSASPFAARPFASASSGTKFTNEHEWIRWSGDIGTIGITDFAQNKLGEIVHLDLPTVGTTFKQGDSFGAVDSNKAASSLYAPVDGKVTEVNTTLTGESLSLVNSSPEDKAWMIKIKMANTKQLDALLDDNQYKAFCDSQH